MIPGAVLIEVDRLYPTIAIPAHRRNPVDQRLDRAALGIFEVELMVDPAPLNAVTLGKVTLLDGEDVDVAHLPAPGIPADDPAMFVGEADDLAAVRFPAEIAFMDGEAVEHRLAEAGMALDEPARAVAMFPVAHFADMRSRR